MVEIKKILLPVDGSSFSERAGEYALALAEKMGTELVVVNVIRQEIIKKLDETDIEKFKLQRAKNIFGSIPHEAAQHGVPTETKIIIARSVSAAILDESRDGEYNLIVMGSHGLGGLRKFILGSVTEDVLKKSTIPVLVVR